MADCICHTVLNTFTYSTEFATATVEIRKTAAQGVVLLGRFQLADGRVVNELLIGATEERKLLLEIACGNNPAAMLYDHWV